MAFSETKFRRLIKERGYRGIEPFAKAAHISGHVLYRWFAKGKVGRLSMVTKVANALDMSLSDFLCAVHAEKSDEKVKRVCNPGRTCFQCQYSDCIAQTYLPVTQEEVELTQCGNIIYKRTASDTVQ